MRPSTPQTSGGTTSTHCRGCRTGPMHSSWSLGRSRRSRTRGGAGTTSHRCTAGRAAGTCGGAIRERPLAASRRQSVPSSGAPDGPRDGRALQSVASGWRTPEPCRELATGRRSRSSCRSPRGASSPGVPVSAKVREDYGLNPGTGGGRPHLHSLANLTRRRGTPMRLR